MILDKLPHWLQVPVAALGGAGLFLIGFLDSSILTFPVVNDLLLIELSIHRPARMPYYALMATLGSIAGCVFLYYLARKGGEALFRKRAGGRAQRIRDWIGRNGFVSILVAAMLPPPAPFKLFVFAAGALQMPLRMFVLALVVARSLRYFGEGFLAVRYGDTAVHYVTDHKLLVSLAALGVVLFVYLLVRVAFRTPQQAESR